MTRSITALLAALEALIAVAVGIGIPLVSLTILWATAFGHGPDWVEFWRAAADVWLLGHGVDVTVHLPLAFAASTGLPGAEQPITLGIALLGFAVLTVVFGVRAGRRAASSRSRVLAVLVSAVVFEVLAALVVLSAGSAIAQPSRLQGLVLPGLVYVVAVVAGSEWGMQRLPDEDRDALARSIRRAIERWPAMTSAVLASASRGAVAAVSGTLGIAAVLTTISLLANYSTVIGLYETLHAGFAGGIALTLLQLALLPNLVIWAAAWIVGPGFAIGAASSVSPAGTVLGSLPGLPVFGALPHGTPALGWLGVLVPVGLGLAAGWFCARRMPDAAGTGPRIVAGLGIGVFAGVVLGLLSWWAGGAIGPGRLAVTGPSPWLVAAFAALEIGIPAVIGLVAASAMRADHDV
jgi:hypothetical protein